MQNALPFAGFLRLRQILGDSTANPPIPPIIPVSKSNWFAGVHSGKYPKPIKLFGQRISLWPVEVILALRAQIIEESATATGPAKATPISERATRPAGEVVCNAVSKSRGRPPKAPKPDDDHATGTTGTTTINASYRPAVPTEAIKGTLPTPVKRCVTSFRRGP
jgi:prophage regulatory protein